VIAKVWFGALIGPTALPMLLGMLLPFRRSGPGAAIACWITGAVTFGALKIFPPEQWLGSYRHFANAMMVGCPLAVAFLTYVGVGLFSPSYQPRSKALLESLRAERATELLETI
jgi:SSS family solute:Na+ symporter